MLDVSLLGTGGMMPLPNRFLTSLMCRLKGRLLLIDCGENTQVSIKLLGWGFKCIDVICLTHFHADHVAGLPGLLLTIGNSGRTETLNIIGPKGVENVVNSLRVIAPELPYEIAYTELKESGNEDIVFNDFLIKTCLLKHRVTCYGYSINILRKGKFLAEKALKLNIPKDLWSKLQNNMDVIYENKLYTKDMVMGLERKGIKVTYCTDTRPIEGLSEFAKESDLFICEGLYGEDEKKEKAAYYTHMVFSEAATVAKEANVKEMWLTHFSPSLVEPEIHLSAAKDIFENTVIGQDRMCKTILFE
jgi:ribonuclease Z